MLAIPTLACMHTGTQTLVLTFATRESLVTGTSEKRYAQCKYRRFLMHFYQVEADIKYLNLPPVTSLISRVLQRLLFHTRFTLVWNFFSVWIEAEHTKKCPVTKMSFVPVSTRTRGIISQFTTIVHAVPRNRLVIFFNDHNTSVRRFLPFFVVNFPWTYNSSRVSAKLHLWLSTFCFYLGFYYFPQYSWLITPNRGLNKWVDSFHHTTKNEMPRQMKYLWEN